VVVGIITRRWHVKVQIKTLEVVEILKLVEIYPSALPGINLPGKKV
jgi:hypothetical protein